MFDGKLMLVALTSGFALSSAFRTVAAILAAPLQADFALSPQALGVFAATFHFSFGAMQLFMGIGIDLYGVRRTILAAFPLCIAGAVVSALAWGLGYFGQPHILARFMAAESVRTIPQARRIGMTWMVLCLGGAILVGFFGISYFEAHPSEAGPVNANPERVFIVLAELLFNPWIAGILLSAILAAVMSTLSCQLLVCASALTEDFYRGFVRPAAGERELVWFGRAMVALVALVAIFLARDPNSRVLGLVSYAWAGFGAAFGPVVLMSLFWRRMNGWGALAGIVVGAATVILWKQYAGSALYEIVPGFIAGGLAVVAGSLLTAAPSREVLATHDAVRAELAQTGY